MKYILCIVLFLSGCSAKPNFGVEQQNYQYSIGQELKIKISGKPAILINYSHAADGGILYVVRYEDNAGQLNVETLAPYELKPVVEETK